MEEEVEELFHIYVFAPFAVNTAESPKQNELLDQIMSIDDIEQKWDSEEVLTKAANWIKLNSN